MALDLNSELSIRVQWAREHATLGIKELLNKKFPYGTDPSQPLPFSPNDPLPPLPRPSPSNENINDGDGGSGLADEIADPKVAIVGAGAAGLFTAMILDYLNAKLESKGFHVSYEIFEAAAKDRVGGRLYAYNFEAGDAQNPPGPHDYYDVGAMRFPDTPVMARTFDLFANLDMEMKKLSDNPPQGSLVPYYLKNFDDQKNALEPWRFNDINNWGAYADAFRLNDDQVSDRHKIPASILTNSPDSTFNETVKELRKALREDLETPKPGRKGFELLLKYDKYSTRQFLGVSQQPAGSTNPNLPPFNYETIEFLETFNGGTNWYDQAHSETVLESLDFEFEDDSSQIKWWAILGGASQLALRMEEKLVTKPAYLSKVTAIRADETKGMEIDIKKATNSDKSFVETKAFNGVFNTTTLGCLKRIDTEKASLNYTTKQAMRSLGYSPSAKVGMKFKHAWWIHDLPEGYKIKRGGLGHSDLSIRTCVYPSYNLDDPSDKPAVLLCSYSWTQDAERLGALMSSSTNHKQQLIDEVELKEVVLRDLARMHLYPGTTEEALYKHISNLYLDHYAHDWTHDPNTAGAFAFFRPQQFTNVWNKLIHPSGNLIIIGEAASPHHAWVVGALESAVHGVNLWLKMRQHEIPGAADAIKVLEEPAKGNPFVGLPPYMDSKTSDWSAANARDDLESFNEQLPGKTNGRGRRGREHHGRLRDLLKQA